LIYDVFSSESELDAKINEALSCSKYGHNKSARTFIESLQNDKHKLCSTITQYVFSYGHTSTKMGEGFNTLSPLRREQFTRVRCMERPYY